LCPEKGGEAVFIKIICAWCGKFMGIKEAEKASLLISHAICCECSQKMLKEVEERLELNQRIQNLIERS
jgi:hypothetical protein